MAEKFIAVVIAGITVFGLVFVVDQAGNADGFFSPSEDVDSMELYNERIGTVGDSQNDFRNIDLGGFTVGKTRGDIRGHYQESVEINDEMFGGETQTFSYNATSPKEAEVTFNVLGREGRGTVYVIANGQRVFEEAMVTDTSPNVKIPERHLQPGINTFEVGVSRQGLFSSSRYVLEDLELTVNDRKFHDHVDNFQLYTYELQDFVNANMKFDITRSVKNSPLRILVNGERVYDKKQVRISPEEVHLSPENANLVPGSNTIEFKTGKDSEYHIANGLMTVRYLGNVDRQDVVLGFNLNQSEQNFVDKQNTREKLVLDYQNLLPSPRPLEIHLNEFNTTLEPKKNKIYNITVPENSLMEVNRIDIRSNGTYELGDLSMVSEKVEE